MFESHLCLCVRGSMWIKRAQLQCWPLRHQKVLHQRWIWAIHCRRARDPPWLLWSHRKDWWRPQKNFFKKYRMHSSRMRTVRCSAHLLGGVCSGGGCLPRGCLSGSVKHAPWTESQTGVKRLPCRNYVADGKKVSNVPRKKAWFWKGKLSVRVISP